MKVNSAIFTSAVALAGMFLSGCVVEERSTYVRRDDRPVLVREGPAPVVVEERPAQEVIIHRDPPPVRVERVGVLRPGEIWVKGYYQPRGEEWVWVGGHAERPPRPNAVWVEPRYEHRPTGEVHVTLGFWR
ncbi:MAG TPA: hypothetical protein VGN88_11795 [Phycisphaerae bacterium]